MRDFRHRIRVCKRAVRRMAKNRGDEGPRVEVFALDEFESSDVVDFEGGGSEDDDLLGTPNIMSKSSGAETIRENEPTLTFSH